MKELVLTRVPPGDRWRDAKTPRSDEIFISLTDGLEHAFSQHDCFEFHINAKEGKVYKVIPDPPAEPEKPKSYSLYGEDY
jgi:hypothetical protein